MSAWQYIKVQPGSERFSLSLLLSALPSLYHVSSSLTRSAFLSPYSPSNSDPFSHALLSSAVSSHNSSFDHRSMIAFGNYPSESRYWIARINPISYCLFREIGSPACEKKIQWDNDLFLISNYQGNYYNVFAKYNQILWNIFQSKAIKWKWAFGHENVAIIVPLRCLITSRLFGEPSLFTHK